MRLFKKIRGQGYFLLSSGSPILGTQKIAFVRTDKLAWVTLWRAHAKHKAEASMKGLSLKESDLVEVKEEPLPPEVSSSRIK